MAKNRIVKKVVFVIWIGIWIFYLARPYFNERTRFIHPKLLRLPISTTLEQRRAIILGQELYDLIQLSLKLIPQDSTFQVSGIDKRSLEGRRLEYYLYPRMLTNNATYLIAFTDENLPRSEYESIAKVHQMEILRRITP